jgi:membrane-associated protease RseP (regulator of RpoE activity)
LRGAWRNALWFALTVASVWIVGGWLLVAAVMSILVAHEMGHYLACRYYRVDASLPYFIPFPIHLAGTLGAFIRIREPFPNRKILFDIGIAGPFAGFLVCLPVLVLGLWEAQVVATASIGDGGISLGEPLLFQWATWAVLGSLPEGTTLLIGPLGKAAWFGLLVTALNLVPVGQLDGGHVSYAILRGRSVLVGRAAMMVSLFLLYLRPTWLLWSVLLFLLGRPHPPTLDDTAPLGTTRTILGLVGALVFAVSFTPNPILITWREYGELFDGLLRWLFT